MNETIEGITAELLDRCGLSIPVLLEKRFPGGRLVGGKFNVGTRTITMYIDTVWEQCLQLLGSGTDFLNYYAIVLAHELGHALDEDLEELAEMLHIYEGNETESEGLIRLAEEKAWDIAREIVYDLDERLFTKIRNEALEMHGEKALV
ncbi:hypothetical protein V1498_17045 [Peribacillus sp. SCS-26]|uniref:hypothetical protein n=1 Tax=Paraperibacillus marinus TaxID=3115295 RepID=UPI0039065FD3